MLSTLLAVNFQPTIRGIAVVVIMFLCLIGSTYLIMATNVGARLGFLITATALAGWMMSMSIIWAVYGIGLKGPDPSWQPNDPITIVRDAALLDRAEVLDAPLDIDGLSATAAGEKAREELIANGWTPLEDSDPRRGQAVAASDDILQVKSGEYEAGTYVAVNVFDKGGERYPKINETLDFFAFFHKPRYAIVEIAPLIEQRVEPGRAPARPQIDTSKQHNYVVMIRDLGAERQPALLIAFGSGIIFFLLAWSLHRREAFLKKNLALTPAKA
ncbi:unannotated protein [freshwater metagenome]|uniref:Unannotated protein n=1 Tax=freshwater metagenome TaxID=449393 RepID=A0A6J6LMD3_9ZZZZ